jgi:hypothetical protein
MNDEITAYIKANRGTYTREAIKAQLIAAGNDPLAIDQALETAWSDSPRPSPKAGAAAGRVQTAWAILLYLAGFSMPVWLFLWTLFDRSSPRAWPIASFVFLVAYAIVGYLVVRWVAEWDPPSGFGAWERAIVGLPVLFALLVGVGFFTTCLAAYRLG